MIEPMIPYISAKPWEIFGSHGFGPFPPGEPSIKPFGVLVAIGVYVGTELIRRLGDRYRLDAQALSSFVVYLLVGGFVGGHVFDSIFYHPEHVMQSPLSLLRIWDGQSSFGGFAGAFLGLLWWRHKFQRSALVYADIVASAFPSGWVFGRSGCSIAHDHPGMTSQSWLAVRYPEGARFDLGLYEMLLTIPLAIAFLVLMRRRRPPGFFLGIMCMAYAPSRFALDFLRIRVPDLGQTPDPRYGGLTPAQWGCLLLLGVGMVLAYRAAKLAEQTTSWLTPEVPPTGTPEGAPAAAPT
jgi:phosphatidylglycerol:prolipoprotein diacylglycerol transferase